MLTGFLLQLLHALLTLIEPGGGEEPPSCYEPLGCFQNDGPWYSPLLRPVPPPQGPEDIDTKIIYFNRKNKNDGLNVYKNLKIEMNNSGFKGNREKTLFIVHGYLSTGNTPWMTQMKNNLLEKMDANVFLVDWGKGAIKFNYFQVASNTRVVGAEIGRFIKHLEKYHNLKPSSIHLIGHSLGAHTCAYAAKNNTGIGRITGLDAAQPAFEGLPKEVRIDKSDAEFVDLIHTNIKLTVPDLGFGLIEPVGHVDIYLNGGLEQPGCFRPHLFKIKSLEDLVVVPFAVLGTWISCSHLKAVEYFSASITSNCTIWARRTTKFQFLYKAITFGLVEPITAAFRKCSSDTCTVVGLETPHYKATGVFAATTVRQYPFCEENSAFDEKIKKEIETDAGHRCHPLNLFCKRYK